MTLEKLPINYEKPKKDSSKKLPKDIQNLRSSAIFDNWELNKK